MCSMSTVSPDTSIDTAMPLSDSYNNNGPAFSVQVSVLILQDVIFTPKVRVFITHASLKVQLQLCLPMD